MTGFTGAFEREDVGKAIEGFMEGFWYLGLIDGWGKGWFFIIDAGMKDFIMIAHDGVWYKCAKNSPIKIQFDLINVWPKTDKTTHCPIID